jgi:hypothetical protein
MPRLFRGHITATVCFLSAPNIFTHSLVGLYVRGARSGLGRSRRRARDRSSPLLACVPRRGLELEGLAEEGGVVAPVVKP